MREDQVVVATFGKGALGANPEGALLEACEPSCRFRFGEVAISPFVILHARFGNERFSVCQLSHAVGQILMGFALKLLPNRDWPMFLHRQSIVRAAPPTN